MSLAFEAAARRLVNNVEILRTVSSCDIYVQLIFWEILHEIMWASRILTNLRLTTLLDCVNGQEQSEDTAGSRRQLEDLGKERQTCDSILAEQLGRRVDTPGTCENIPSQSVSARIVLGCTEFSQDDPKPTGFLSRLDDYPIWTSIILKMLKDLEQKMSKGEKLILDRPKLVEDPNVNSSLQEKEIVAFVREEGFLKHQERLQSAWDKLARYIIETESGFGGSRFPPLRLEDLDSTSLSTNQLSADPKPSKSLDVKSKDLAQAALAAILPSLDMQDLLQELEKSKTTSKSLSEMSSGTGHKGKETLYSDVAGASSTSPGLVP
ncbi:uncharacterized protein IL334_007777 [Kwoniella shivajii]|uniref:Uncharacterized protein n=1 Tax=Kwoniella shivajii TaxID=564305 RepID=A0ABZ1D9L7_9TREE|nr:hypothetical protein IL334_007777 [Kwoniella shivajii]